MVDTVVGTVVLVSGVLASLVVVVVTVVVVLVTVVVAVLVVRSGASVPTVPAGASG